MQEYRNPRWSGGLIDVEINHPEWGWTPLTIDEADYPALWAIVIATGGIADEPTGQPALPESISFIQLIGGLKEVGWISEPEAGAWFHAGILPAAAANAIASLPAEQQFMARLRATRPTEVLPQDPLVQMLAQAEGKTPEEMAQFFIFAATL